MPLQYYGIGMLHKTQVKVKGTLNCDIITTTCICKDQITQGTFLLHMLHHSRNLYKPKRVIFEKKASLNPPPQKNILMKHFTLYIKCLRFNSVEIKKRIGK